MWSSTSLTKSRRLGPAGSRRAACLVIAVLGGAGCSQSDRFLGAQIDFQLGRGASPTLDLGRVGPAKWTRACVLGPYVGDAQARALLGFAWPAAQHTSIDRREDITVLVFTDGVRVLAFVERPRKDGDFTGVQPPCVTRDAARLATRRDRDGRLVVVRPGPAATPAASLPDGASPGVPVGRR